MASDERGWQPEPRPDGEYTTAPEPLRDRCASAVVEAMVSGGKTELDVDSLVTLLLDAVIPLVAADTAERIAAWLRVEADRADANMDAPFDGRALRWAAEEVERGAWERQP